MAEASGSYIFAVGVRYENRGLMHICSLFYVAPCCGLLVSVAVLTLTDSMRLCVC